MADAAAVTANPQPPPSARPAAAASLTPRPPEFSKEPGTALPIERVDDGFVAVATEDLLALFNIAKTGLAKAQWKPAPRWTDSYRAIRKQLMDVGAIPR